MYMLCVARLAELSMSVSAEIFRVLLLREARRILKSQQPAS